MMSDNETTYRDLGEVPALDWLDKRPDSVWFKRCRKKRKAA